METTPMYFFLITLSCVSLCFCHLPPSFLHFNLTQINHTSIIHKAYVRTSYTQYFHLKCFRTITIHLSLSLNEKLIILLTSKYSGNALKKLKLLRCTEFPPEYGVVINFLLYLTFEVL